MIIQKQKDWDTILQSMGDCKSVFIVGCGECAATCKTGGEEEVASMKMKLESAGKEVTGTIVMKPACHSGEVRRAYRADKAAFDRADIILVLACGTGTQTVGDHLDKIVYSGVESLFVGEVIHMGNYYEKCSTCGECVLDKTAGICPVTRCSKGLLNGPCGGEKNGKCEATPGQDCAWVLIYHRLRERKQKKHDKMLIKSYYNHKPRQLNWKKEQPE